MIYQSCISISHTQVSITHVQIRAQSFTNKHVNMIINNPKVRRLIKSLYCILCLLMQYYSKHEKAYHVYTQGNHIQYLNNANYMNDLSSSYFLTSHDITRFLNG